MDRCRATGAAAPIAGWLIKLVDVRAEMGAGATLAGFSLLGIHYQPRFFGVAVSILGCVEVYIPLTGNVVAAG
jgi:hypothetical protein